MSATAMRDAAADAISGYRSAGIPGYQRLAATPASVPTFEITGDKSRISRAADVMLARISASPGCRGPTHKDGDHGTGSREAPESCLITE